MADEDKGTVQSTEEDSAELDAQDDDNEEHTNKATHSSVSANSTHPEDLRKSQRTRTLTEKGKSLQEAKLRDLIKDFERLYKKWKYHINCFRRFMKSKDMEIIAEAVSTIDAFEKDIYKTYDEIRKMESPDIEIRRKCDVCCAISHAAKAKAQCLLEQNGNPEEIPWPDSESVFERSSGSVSSGITCKSKVMSNVSKRSSLGTQQRQEAAAEVAASEEVIKIMKTQHQREKEIRELEVEDARKRAQFLTESTTIKTKLEEKRKEVELLKEMKKHNAAQARLKVYAESINSENEDKSVLHSQIKQNSSYLPLSFPNVYSKSFFPSQVAARTSYQAPLQASVTQTAAPSMEQVATIDLVKTLAEAITANRIPIPEPAVFTGDPLQYNDWKLSFQTLVDRKNLPIQEKLFFLRKYVGGSAKKAIEGHFLVGTDSAYLAAWETLEDRFGNPFVIGKSYRDKIQLWPKITTKDSKDLREFADFLSSVESAMPYVQGLQVLNDCVENMRIAAKLPDWLSTRWNRTVTEFQDEHKMFPDFSHFVKFLNKEARIACNPITSLQAIKSSDQDHKHFIKDKLRRSHTLNAKTLSTSTNEKESMACLFCKKPGHALHTCRKIMEKTVEERVKFVQSEKLCFGCLKSGHNSKSCTSRSVCDKCQKAHPTCLHQDREKRDKEQNPKTNQETVHVSDPQQQDSKHVTSNRVIQQKTQGCTSSVIPVYISTVDNPEKEKLVYALLDTQSDTTFILKDTAESLNTMSEPVKLKISTITSKTKIVSSHKLIDLQVRGMNSETRIKLPTTYTRDYIPANRSHIPTSKTAENWFHLKHLSKEMAPKLDCEVGLLIGYNCPQALLPLEVVSGERDQPFAQKTLLGWSIIGYSHSESDYEDEIGVSHRVIVKQVLPTVKSSEEIKAEVLFVNRNKVKEVITPAEIMKVLEMDFVERTIEEESMSQEDLMFLSKVKEGIKQKEDGHFEMPLPFKEERPDLPNNKLIRSNTEPSQWRYVAYEQNPADHASRGVMTKELVESNWFTGPSFLWKKELPEEEVKVIEVSSEDPELKVTQVFIVKAKEEKSVVDRLQKFSDWKRVVKAIARLKRRVKYAKNPKEMSNESSTLEERKEAEEFIVRSVQEEAFSEEIKSLKETEEVKVSHSKLHQLSPFLDEHNMLRVGGRLTRASLHPYVKHPAILPKEHHVSRLLLKHFHEKIHHQGRGMTVNEIRANGIWIVGCSSEVSSFIHKCVKCRKYRKSSQEQKMSDLPSERMEATPPFTYSGMDCFGPFYVKERRKDIKRYGLLFTCMCSRAIHIEVLEDLSMDCFLNALRCFISIRGNVSQLHCDQGTNFVGAKNEFLNLTQATKEKAKELGISFIFNPPASSHMGGVWERQIRTIRNVLRSILDQSASSLDTSSLRTFMYETMAIVNSRPLTVECINDPVGPEPLTPNHILTMKSTVISPPPGEFVKEDLYLQKRWKRVQYLTNVFWTRWRKEYLLNLQQRSKWNKTRRNTKINDIVLLQDDCVQRNQWKLARVVEVTPGADGKVRKVKLLLRDSTQDNKGTHTNKTVLERPIHKTILLLEAE